MSPRGSLSLLAGRSQAQVTTIAVSAGVAMMLLATLTLTGLSRPSGLNRRLRHIDYEVSQVEALRSLPGDANLFPPGAICSHGSSDVSLILRRNLGSMAEGLHLPLVKISVSNDFADAGHAVQPTRFELQVNGSYATVIGMLKVLATYKPEIFIDRADIKSETSFVQFHLDGRVYCWKGAPS